MPRLTRLLAATLLAALPFTVAAQSADTGTEASITLQIEAGSVLVSSGGEFGAAAAG